MKANEKHASVGFDPPLLLHSIKGDKSSLLNICFNGQFTDASTPLQPLPRQSHVCKIS